MGRRSEEIFPLLYPMIWYEHNKYSDHCYVCSIEIKGSKLKYVILQALHTSQNPVSHPPINLKDLILESEVKDYIQAVLDDSGSEFILFDDPKSFIQNELKLCRFIALVGQNKLSKASHSSGSNFKRKPSNFIDRNILLNKCNPRITFSFNAFRNWVEII